MKLREQRVLSLGAVAVVALLGMNARADRGMRVSEPVSEVTSTESAEPVFLTISHVEIPPLPESLYAELAVDVAHLRVERTESVLRDGAIPHRRVTCTVLGSARRSVQEQVTLILAGAIDPETGGGLIVKGSPELEAGREYVVFLWSDDPTRALADGEWGVLGLAHGVREVVHDGAGTDRWVSEAGRESVAQFLDRMARFAEGGAQ